jgi:hypothetical protein
VPGRKIRRAFIVLVITVIAPLTYVALRKALPPGKVSFTQSSEQLEAFDFVEIAANVAAPRAVNPFTDAMLKGIFVKKATDEKWGVEGFCDSADGSVFRIRFMPPSPGEYTYSLRYKQGWGSRSFSGSFRVVNGGRRGPLRVDPQNRWHFIWEGTGEHYFFNGTTAYWLMGWSDESTIRASLERLHRLKVNRVRVTVAGRTDNFHGEPVFGGSNWNPLPRPWETSKVPWYLHSIGRAGQILNKRLGTSIWEEGFDSLAEVTEPRDIYHPGFDYSKFNVAYWQKFERALQFARERDTILSVVLDMGDSPIHPAAGGEDERRFIRYAIARFAAFSNITWDLGDDLDSFRDDTWTHKTGMLVLQLDLYHHLATSHPISNAHQDRTAEWFGFTSFQEWSREQHAFMLEQRKKQASLGRIIPQANEEYGYEDHYPLFAPKPPGDSADVLRRTAWEIAMAGGYGTTGETARRGTNFWPDTGGGWMNGRGDDSMVMLKGYAHLVDFFTSFDWWKTEPRDDLVSGGNYCVAEVGRLYAVYLPHGGSVTVRLDGGDYMADWFDPSTGKEMPIGRIRGGGRWASPVAPGTNDWALRIRTAGEGGK